LGLDDYPIAFFHNCSVVEFVRFLSPGALMRTLLSALRGAVLGALAGVALCALGGAVWFESNALRSPNADLRPDSAWMAGAIWIGIGLGPYAGAVGAVVGLVIAMFVGANRSSAGEV
jgi:hypothetical protein